jgi:glycosyltransferase involved in cell wall biosynthesis
MRTRGPAPLRVAFDGRSLASPVLRGWDRYAVGLVGELARRGAEVTLLHRARRPLHGPHVADLGCRVLGLADRGGLHYEQVAVPRALGRGRFDLFHAPFEHGVPLAAPCPAVLTIHSVTAASYADLIRRGLLPGRVRDYLGHDVPRWSVRACYWRAQVARADHILTPSAFCREEVIRLLGVPPGRVTVTPLAVAAQFRRPALAAADRAAVLRRLGVRTPYVLYVGGYEPHKNVAGLLEAFALVRAARPAVSLVTVGSTAVPEAARTQARRLGLDAGGAVAFLVGLTDDLTTLYDEAELLVTLSWRETFCLPALEAMTRGIPTVASAWGAAPEVVAETGRLIDPRDPAAARDAILDLLAAADRAAQRERLRERARRFDWGQTATRTLGVYDRLLGGRSAAGVIAP